LKALAERHSRLIDEALASTGGVGTASSGTPVSCTRSAATALWPAKTRPRAIEAYEHAAVRINPALPATWSMLEGLYKMARQDALRDMATEHVQRLKSMHPDVVKATGLFCEGDLVPAEKLVRADLIAHGDHPEAMRLLARIAVSREILDEAEVLLEAALELAPDYIELRRDYACILLDRHKHVEAMAELDRLLADRPYQQGLPDAPSHRHRRPRRPR
jgi:tetratricopeptide (TPR) repeat protein